MFEAGILLIRIYQREINQLSLDYRQILKGARTHLMGIAYLCIPLIFAYLILWMILGIFYLLKAIPLIGSLIGAVFSFGPFLLVLGSLILSVSNLLLLFYITPIFALTDKLHPRVVTKSAFKQMTSSPFKAIFMPLVAILPLLLVVGILSLAAIVTDIMYLSNAPIFSIALKWFFIMIPFAVILCPVVVFFFNFSLETHTLLQKKVSI